MGIAFPLTPAPEKQKSSALARSGFFLFPRVFQCVCPANEHFFRLENFSWHPTALPVESTVVLRLYRLRSIAKPAGCRQAMVRFASFHRGGASPRCRNRMHPVPSNGQNKSDQLSSFDYGWSPLLWPL